MFNKYIAKKYKLKRNCHSCLYRHGCPWDFDEMFTEDVWDNCKHWKLGKCYTCKYVDESDEQEWYKRNCEAYCFGGCSKYHRQFKKTIQFRKLIGDLSNDFEKNS